MLVAAYRNYFIVIETEPQLKSRIKAEAHVVVLLGLEAEETAEVGVDGAHAGAYRPLNLGTQHLIAHMEGPIKPRYYFTKNAR